MANEVPFEVSGGLFAIVSYDPEADVGSMAFAEPKLRGLLTVRVLLLCPQVPQWEGDNQLRGIHGLPSALFPERHSSCPPPLQSLLLTHGCMTSPTPQLLPTATTSLGRMPPLPGPVTSITAPFYDASFRCQVCLPADLGGRWEHDRTTGAQALSQPSLRVGVQLDRGSMPMNCREVQKTSRSERATWDWSVLVCDRHSRTSSCWLWNPPDQVGAFPWQPGQRSPTKHFLGSF